MRLVHVVAMGQNRVIGRAGSLPWRLAGDMRYFKKITMGKPVIAGRKTWESVGGTLPGRRVIVVSRRGCPPPPADSPAPPGVIWVSSPDKACEAAERLCAELGVEEAAVIGGAEIYAQTLERVCRVYVTEVEASPQGEVCYPEVDWSSWREVSRRRPAPEPGDTARYAFVVRERETETP